MIGGVNQAGRGNSPENGDPQSMAMEINRDSAWSLLTEFVNEPSLIRHCLSVEACMREYARIYGEDEELWAFVGLIHDFDFQVHPTLDQHPQDGAPILRERGVPEHLVQAVLSHADHLDVPRDTLMKKALAAVDELSSFVVAVALVRPNKSLDDLEPKSVKKKMKDKAFARAVDRQAMLETAEDLGVDFDEHVRNIVNGLRPIAAEVGLNSASQVA
jgi:putative nucleotidyltransferase with HDIG domain